MDDRTGRPEQIMAPALRSIIKTIDLAIENGSLDPKDRDKVIKMFISGPTTVVDNKRGGGMMNIDEMIRPIGMAGGGLMDDMEDLKTLIMKAEILDNKIGKVAPMSVFMELNNMSPKELMDAYIEYGGSKFR